MRRISLRLVPLLLLAFALPLSAQSFQDEVATDLTGVKAKWLQLFDAMPDETMTWRPEEGVRSVSELYMHIALANVGLPTNLLGAPMPANARAEWQAQGEALMDRESIRAAVETGFDHVIGMVRGMSDAELQEPVNVFGRDTNAMGAVMLLQTHSHEHLGQAIAYARMNGVTPPWSM